MRLVSDWKQCARWFSVQAMVISTAMLATWALLPDDLKASLPAPAVTWTAVGILVLGVVGRLVDQEKH